MADDDLIRRGDAVLAVTAADKECLGANGAREFIRALPAVTPAVKVKPLVWEAYEPGHPMKLFRAYCDTLRQEWIIWVDCPDVPAEKAQVEAIRAARILSALDVTPAPTLAEALELPEVKALVEAVDGLIGVLNEHETKGPLTDEAMMFCWLAAQKVRAVRRKMADAQA